MSASTKNTPVSFGWLLWLFLFPCTLSAQSNKPELYQLRITTNTSDHITGTLFTIYESTLYLENEYRGRTQIPLSAVRKVRVRKFQPQTRPLAGAVAGAVVVGLAANRDLQNGSPRSPVLYGITLLFATIGGAAAGGVAGKLSERIGQKQITFRSNGEAESVARLQQQLAPYSVTYQKNLIH